MGALVSSLLETFFGESGNWIENGFRRGYFALDKHWEASDVAQAKEIISSATSIRLTSLSLVGQTFASPTVLQDLLQLVVARPELETLRLTATARTTPIVQDKEEENVTILVETVVAKHRPPPSTAGPKLRVEYLSSSQDVAAYWRELTQLPSENMLVLTTTTMDKV